MQIQCNRVRIRNTSLHIQSICFKECILQGNSDTADRPAVDVKKDHLNQDDRTCIKQCVNAYMALYQDLLNEIYLPKKEH